MTPTSPFFYRCDTSSTLTKFVQFTFKSLGCNHHHLNEQKLTENNHENECNECDVNTERNLLSLFHELVL